MWNAKHHHLGLLTTEVKESLEKPHWQRETADWARIWSLVEQIGAFSQYPESIRRELARVINYGVFEDGTTIISEGNRLIVK